jgi:trans-aconitate methyltransferase
MDLDSGSREYLHFHARRFAYLVEIVKEAAKGGGTGRILDVGPAFQTALFRDALPQHIVNTLGYEDGRFSHRAGEVHFAIDLNETQYPERCPTPSIEHDIVVMAEVIEHLYTAPQLVLRYLSGWLRPGGVLLLQTPNAVSLGKRLGMLRGYNPFEMIRDQRSNPGHFREYTISELHETARVSGYEMERFECRNYFGSTSHKAKVYDALCTLGPGYLHEGITAWLRKNTD